jgi:hypothetical protein
MRSTTPKGSGSQRGHKAGPAAHAAAGRSFGAPSGDQPQPTMKMLSPPIALPGDRRRIVANRRSALRKLLC